MGNQPHLMSHQSSENVKRQTYTQSQPRSSIRGIQPGSVRSSKSFKSPLLAYANHYPMHVLKRINDGPALMTIRNR